MPEPPDLNSADLGKAIAGKVRKTSRGGRLIPLGEIWKGTGDDFTAWQQSEAAVGVDDIVLIKERGGEYLYSELHMTWSYAETAARAACGDLCYAIAQTVRSDSSTYPRPTPIEVFSESPFLFPKDLLDLAIQDIQCNPDYEDIRQVRASSGALYLFSSIHLSHAHAESLAEWLAVSHLQNP
jgi:hypothetical protein